MTLFPWDVALQMLVVLTSQKDSIEGFLFCYERKDCFSDWKKLDSTISINVGEKGMALGRGLYEFEIFGWEEKKEGDRKSPAGIFSLGTVFGDETHRIYAKKTPFLLISEDLESVDDPNSIHYNHFVDSKTLIRDWKSSEKMSEVGAPYQLGLEIKHNLDPVIAGKGSSIFMHIWSSRGVGSFGCTTMEKQDLCSVVSWLDQEKKPCLVQFPKKEYEKIQEILNLPKLEEAVLEEV